jgi:acyl carrier protein
MATRTAEIQQTIFELLGAIAPEADLSTLPQDVDVRKALDIDSFDFLNVMIGLNDAFGVEIPETDYNKLVTLRDMTTYIATHAH